MAGLKKFVNNLIDKKVDPVKEELGAVAAVAAGASEELATKSTFYVIASNGTIAANTRKVTVGTKERVLKVGDFVYKPASIPELWVCVEVGENTTTNVKIALYSYLPEHE